MSGVAAALRVPPPVTSTRASPAPLRIGSCVRYSKADAFEICGALALAESVLRSLGCAADAALLGSVFEVAEAGLARSRDHGGHPVPGYRVRGGGDPVGAGGQPLGSNSTARELTQ